MQVTVGSLFCHAQTAASVMQVDDGGRCTPVKVILLGEPGVGKTSIFRRLKTGSFHERPSLTGIVDHLDWDYRVGKKGITLLITDTGGSDKQFSMMPSYYRDAMAVILVYAVDKDETFHRIRTEWLPIARDRVPEGALLFLFGNKTDLRNEVCTVPPRVDEKVPPLVDDSRDATSCHRLKMKT